MGKPKDLENTKAIQSDHQYFVPLLGRQDRQIGHRNLQMKMKKPKSLLLYYFNF